MQTRLTNESSPFNVGERVGFFEGNRERPQESPIHVDVYRSPDDGYAGNQEHTVESSDVGQNENRTGLDGILVFDAHLGWRVLEAGRRLREFG